MAQHSDRAVFALNMVPFEAPCREGFWACYGHSVLHILAARRGTQLKVSPPTPMPRLQDLDYNRYFGTRLLFYLTRVPFNSLSSCLAYVKMKASHSLAISFLGLFLLISSSCASSNYWVANIGRFGESAFSPNASTYKVFRNVMDPQFGAKGNVHGLVNVFAV